MRQAFPLRNGRLILPACAGTTATTGAGTCCSAAHPRACGDHIPPKIARFRYDGSSPRVRGPPRGRTPRQPTRRLIPARAGTTIRIPSPRSAGTAHPRACGDHSSDPILRASISGSSPRVRGPRGRHHEPDDDDRLIPARAGTTQALPCSLRLSAAHPRACGDHGRGPADHDARQRLIPARAGTTRILAPRARPFPGSSPRVRGPQLAEAREQARERLIPARAGTTHQIGRCAFAQAAHPRACGDHTSPGFAVLSPDGSSPRVRGPRSSSTPPR